jgi:hypothetical protein
MLHELFNGLPRSLQKWIRAHKKLLGFLLRALSYVIVGLIFTGLVQGAAYDSWKNEIVPWLSTKLQDITNGWVTLLSLGWIFTVVATPLAFLSYASDRQRLVQLDIVNRNNTENRLARKELETKVTHLAEAIDILKRENKEREIQILDLVISIQRQVLVLIADGSFGVEESHHVFESVCRRIFDLFDNGQHPFRACVYTPDPKDPTVLIIEWDHGVGEASRMFNRWYIGPLDPQTINKHRGIPGVVYITDKSRVVPEVRHDPDFWDAHIPPRAVLPYRSLLQIVIRDSNTQQKYGLLCIDSENYIFTDHDLQLVERIATWLGWLIKVRGTQPATNS